MTQPATGSLQELKGILAARKSALMELFDKRGEANIGQASFKTIAIVETKIDIVSVQQQELAIELRALNSRLDSLLRALEAK